MRILTQLSMVVDAVQEGDIAAMDQHLANLRDSVDQNIRLVQAVLDDHRDHHTFGAATCWSNACRLAADS